MKVRYTLYGIMFEWDSQKAAANLRKHQIAFEQACEVFFDPFVRYIEDEVVNYELRETILGLTASWQLLFVIYVSRGEVIRIISGRTATHPEREAYENQ